MIKEKYYSQWNSEISGLWREFEKAAQKLKDEHLPLDEHFEQYDELKRQYDEVCRITTEKWERISEKDEFFSQYTPEQIQEAARQIIKDREGT